MGSTRKSFGESMSRLWNELSFTPAGEFLFEQGTRHVHTSGGGREGNKAIRAVGVVQAGSRVLVEWE